MPDICSNPSCSKPSPLKCGRCKNVHYCSQPCQTTHWPAHKAACKVAAAAARQPTPQQKSNCYILRASSGTATAPALTNIPDHVEPFHLSNLGDEVAEKRQLQRRLGWKGSMEVGKFYDHAGSDAWYYYVYGDARAFDAKAGLPANEVAGLVCHQRRVYGDVGVVRSGPLGSEYAEEFSKMDLVKAVEFYKTNDQSEVFGKREMGRAMRNFGITEAESVHVHI